MLIALICASTVFYLAIAALRNVWAPVLATYND